MILTVPHDSGSGSGDGEPMSSPDPMSPPIGGPGFVGLEIAGLSLGGNAASRGASGSHNASLGVGDKETSFRSSLGSHSMADSDDSANRSARKGPRAVARACARCACEAARPRPSSTTVSIVR